MPQSSSKQPGRDASAARRLETVSWPLKFGHWLIGFLALSAVIVIIAHFSEIERFTQLLERAAPVWLLAAVMLQVATYFSTAAIWYLTLREA